MSLVKTYAQIAAKVRLDTDTQDTDFVTFDELVGYCNEAIDEAEAEIHNFYEDYFLTSDLISLVAGTAEYAMPTNIYANKIRSVVYHNGSVIYKVKRVRDADKFLKAAINDQSGSQDYYRYIIINDSVTAGVQMKLYPASRETSSTIMRRWYIRNATRVPLASEGSEAATNAIQIDIPEFHSFIEAWMKYKIHDKENHPRAGDSEAAMEKKRVLMIKTLKEMVPDNDTIIDMDYSFYDDFYANDIYVSDS